MITPGELYCEIYDTQKFPMASAMLNTVLSLNYQCFCFRLSQQKPDLAKRVRAEIAKGTEEMKALDSALQASDLDWVLPLFSATCTEAQIAVEKQVAWA